MSKLFPFFTSIVGTKRHSGNTIDSQQRDVQLYLDHFVDTDYKLEDKHGNKLGSYGNTYLYNYELKEVLYKHLQDSGDRLLVASLSCLGSNSNEIAQVIDELNGEIKVAELPNATAEELKVYAKLEDSKKKFMGVRSKAGIEQAKADGKNIGGLRGKTKERNEQKAKEANDMAESLKSYLLMFVERGFTLKQGADLLNERGIKTVNGKEFKPMTVKRYLDRYQQNVIN